MVDQNMLFVSNRKLHLLV